MNAVQMPQVDIVDCLLRQNLYQRLGLKTNIVCRGELESAYRARLVLLENCQAELTQDDMRKARGLLDEAINRLRDSASRAAYDEELSVLRRLELGRRNIPATPLATSVKARSTDEHLVTDTTEGLAEPVPQTKSLNESALASRYSIQHLLADSPRCKVYSAVDNHLSRRVVIKRIQPELFAKKDHQEMFTREAQLFASSNASNLVKILDFDSDTGSIVVERMSRDLAQVVKDRKCEPDELREILRDALTGLAALHDQGIAHGRIEPGHLFLDDSGSVKLSVTPGMSGVSTTLRPGSETRHVAPELLNAKIFGPAGLPADIYSLGFVAIELLCGKNLAGMVNPAIEAQGASKNGWLLWHASPTDTLPPILSLAPSLPQDLVQLLTRMTSKKQQERFSDARECLGLLRQRQGEGGSPQAASPVVGQPSVIEGIEMLGGLPPSLHEHYHVQEVINWKDILNQPKLLFQPEARSKLITIIIGSIASAATILLLLVGAPQPMELATTDSRLKEQSDTNILQHPEEEPLKPIDSYSEVVVAPVPALNPTSKISLVPVGSSHSPRLNEELPWKDFDTVEPDPKFPEKSEPANLPKSTSPLSVGHLPFVPTHASFDILGAETPDKSWRQHEAIMRALDLIIRNGHGRFQGLLPYDLSIDQVVDPRASFAVACLYYQMGDSHKAESFCFKAIEDGRKLRAPYVIPHIFLSHLLVEKAENSQALIYCQDAMRWNWQHWIEHSDPRYREAATTMVWWLGVLTGFVEEVKGSAIASTVDVQGAEQMVRSWVGSDSEVFEKFQFARESVRERFKELASQRIAQAGKSSSGRNATPSEVFDLPLSSSFSSFYGAEDEFFDNPANENLSGMSQNLMGGEISLSLANSEVREPQVRIVKSVALPKRLRSYQPLDLCALADQTRSTFRKSVGWQAGSITQSRNNRNEFSSSDPLSHEPDVGPAQRLVKSW